MMGQGRVVGLPLPLHVRLYVKDGHLRQPRLRLYVKDRRLRQPRVRLYAEDRRIRQPRILYASVFRLTKQGTPNLLNYLQFH